MFVEGVKDVPRHFQRTSPRASRSSTVCTQRGSRGGWASAWRSTRRRGRRPHTPACSPLVLGDRWQTLTVPTLFLGAERDVFVRPKFENALQAIAEGNPNIRLARIPDAGHLPWLDEPERVVAEIERFLATQPRSGVQGAA
jgi:pimeloyl-ACP methyl ester carboxylesterase